MPVASDVRRELRGKGWRESGRPRADLLENSISSPLIESDLAATGNNFC